MGCVRWIFGPSPPSSIEWLLDVNVVSPSCFRWSDRSADRVPNDRFQSTAAIGRRPLDDAQSPKRSPTVSQPRVRMAPPVRSLNELGVPVGREGCSDVCHSWDGTGATDPKAATNNLGRGHRSGPYRPRPLRGPRTPMPAGHRRGRPVQAPRLVRSWGEAARSNSRPNGTSAMPAP